LESKSIEATISEEVVSDKTNILIGTKNSKGFVENYVNKNIEYDSTIFNELGAYVLHMDKVLEEKGTIAILGSSTDAAYYSLAT
jgi:hyaluronoglucosaminidase